MRTVDHQSRLSRRKENLLIVYKDKDRKPVLQILYEFLRVSLNKKCIASHYFTSFLYKKGQDNYMDYLSHREWRHAQEFLCDDETMDITQNKILFQEYFGKIGIPLPRMLAYNLREKIVLKNGDGWTSRKIDSHETMHEIINFLLGISVNQSIFIKPVRGFGGGHAQRISYTDGKLSGEMTRLLYVEIVKSSFIIQDNIKQHRILAELNPSSVNTIRIDTFKGPDREPEILSAYLRIGASGNYVDNVMAGGLFVGINLEDGSFKNIAYREFQEGEKALLDSSKTRELLHGLSLPFFEDVKRIAVEAASWLPEALLGWDIAVTDQGPVVIECNTLYYDTSGSDIAYGGYGKNPVFQKVMDYIKSNS